MADTTAAPAIAAATHGPRLVPMSVPPLPVLGSFTGGHLPLGQSHTPSKQVRPSLQTSPQAPQLLLSQQVATHMPSQFTSPSAQQSPLGQSQMPSKQVRPGGQTLPQAPQCWLLQHVSTQTPPQSAWPSAQLPPAAQTPPLQTALAQGLAQAPQCSGSEEKSRQPSTAPQYSIPTGQVARSQTPLRHSTGTRPLSQISPHAPQLFRSDWRSTQTPPQSVSPLSQAYASPCAAEARPGRLA